MAVTNEQVFNWLQANPNATDAEIAQAAAAAGVSAQQLSEVTGVPVSQIEARVAAAAPTIQLPPPAPVAVSMPSAAPVAPISASMPAIAEAPASAPPATTWDYNKYFESLKSQSTDFNAALGALGSQDPTMAKNAQNVYKEIVAQQKAGSAEYWYKGNTASIEAAAADMALRLAENGVSSLRDVGQKQIKQQDGEGGETTTTVLVNKQTGEALPRQDLIGRGSKGLDIDYNLHFTEDGSVIPYTSNRTSSWVNFRESTLKPIAGIALAAYGVPYVSTAIAGTTIGGVTLTAGSALTTGVATGLVSGGASLLGGASFEDALKNALTSGLTAGATAGYADTIGQSLGFEAGSIASKAAGNAIIAGAKAGITDEDVLTNMASAAVATYLSNKNPAFDATEREGSLAKTVFDDDTMTTDFGVNADYSLASNLRFGSNEGINVDNRGVGEGFELTGGSTPFTGLQTSTTPNLTAMGGGQGLTATKTDGSTLAGKDFTTGPSLKDVETAIKIGGVVLAGNEVIDRTIGLGGTKTTQPRDIYRDAPLAGFKMVKYEDPATGGSKYIPFVGEEALLPPPTGYNRITYAKGGFVSRR